MLLSEFKIKRYVRKVLRESNGINPPYVGRDFDIDLKRLKKTFGDKNRQLVNILSNIKINLTEVMGKTTTLHYLEKLNNFITKIEQSVVDYLNISKSLDGVMTKQEFSRFSPKLYKAYETTKQLCENFFEDQDLVDMINDVGMEGDELVNYIDSLLDFIEERHKVIFHFQFMVHKIPYK